MLSKKRNFNLSTSTKIDKLLRYHLHKRNLVKVIAKLIGEKMPNLTIKITNRVILFYAVLLFVLSCAMHAYSAIHSPFVMFLRHEALIMLGASTVTVVLWLQLSVVILSSRNTSMAVMCKIIFMIVASYSVFLVVSSMEEYVSDIVSHQSMLINRVLLDAGGK